MNSDLRIFLQETGGFPGKLFLIPPSIIGVGLALISIGLELMSVGHAEHFIGIFFSSLGAIYAGVVLKGMWTTKLVNQKNKLETWLIKFDPFAKTTFVSKTVDYQQVNKECLKHALVGLAFCVLLISLTYLL